MIRAGDIVPPAPIPVFFDFTANQVTLMVGIFTLVAGLVAAFAPAIIKKVRGHSDVRDDSTAENATLKSAAEVAMDLVESTKGWADHLIKAMQLQIDSLTSRIKALEDELRAARTTISALQAKDGNQVTEIARLLERERVLEQERAAALNEVAKLRVIVADARRSAAKLDITPEAIIEHRDTHTGSTPIVGEAPNL